MTKETKEDFEKTIQLAIAMADSKGNAESFEEMIMNLDIAGKTEIADYLEKEISKLKKPQKKDTKRE